MGPTEAGEDAIQPPRLDGDGGQDEGESKEEGAPGEVAEAVVALLTGREVPPHEAESAHGQHVAPGIHQVAHSH